MKFLTMSIPPASDKPAPNFASDKAPKALSPNMKEARKRASKALSNARQRCKNPKNPDYPHYGALGVKVLFSSLDQLTACIGLPKPGQSLDRIDPNGHYQPGNVRWTSQAVQSANKKLAPMSLHYSAAAQIAQTQIALSQQKNRARTAATWGVVRKAYHRGFFSPQDVEFLTSKLACSGALEANFDVNTVPDMLNAAPGFIHLPALSLPDARVRMRCSPSNTPANVDYLDRHGRWAGLEMLEPEWNVPQSIWKRALEMMHPSQTGLVLLGQPSVEVLLGGWIEGAMLALASSLAHHEGVSTAFRPMLSLKKQLTDIGSRFDWDYVNHPILDATVLLIPDFALDCGAWGEFPSSQWWRVNQLLEYRVHRELKTGVGVQNLSKLQPQTRELLLGAFPVLKMPMTPEHDMTPLQFCAAHYPVPLDGCTLTSLKGKSDTAGLVAHNGLIGT